MDDLRNKYIDLIANAADEATLEDLETAEIDHDANDDEGVRVVFGVEPQVEMR